MYIYNNNNFGSCVANPIDKKEIERTNNILLLTRLIESSSSEMLLLNYGF